MADEPPLNLESAAPIFLRERELAKRWDISIRSLQRWRAQSAGPPFFRIGRSFRYLLADVMTFEGKHRNGGGPP